jgi:hypothetical protein
MKQVTPLWIAIFDKQTLNEEASYGHSNTLHPGICIADTERRNGPCYEYGFVTATGSGSPTPKSELYIWSEGEHQNPLVCLESDAATKPPDYLVLISAVMDRTEFLTILHDSAGGVTSNAGWMARALYNLRRSFTAIITPIALTPFDREQLREVAETAKSGGSSKEEKALGDYLLRLSEERD